MSRLLGYARVSTEAQELDGQLRALRAAGCDEIYQEKVSGGKDHRARPELDRLLEEMKPGDILVVLKIDRLSRSLKDLLNILTRLEDADCRFRSLTEAVDTSSAAGRMMMQMIGAVAEFERAMISERTKTGLDAAKKRGSRCGRRPALVTAQVNEVLRQLDEGRRVVDIAKIFGVDRATIYRIKKKRQG